jgi:hypothetical protein
MGSVPRARAASEWLGLADAEAAEVAQLDSVGDRDAKRADRGTTGHQRRCHRFDTCLLKPDTDLRPFGGCRTYGRR